MVELPEWVPSVIPFLVWLALWALAFLVFKTGKERHNRIFATLYFLSGTASLTLGLSSDPDGLAGPGAPLADVWHEDSPYFPQAATLRFVYEAATTFMLPLLLWFVLLFPQPIPILGRRPKVGLALFAIAPISLWVAWTKPVWATDYFVAFSVVATFGTMMALALLFHTRFTSSDPVERKQASYLVLGFLPAFAATWLITINDVASWYFALDVVDDTTYELSTELISPVFEVIAAALTAYAILKYRILGAELKVKGGMKYVLMGLVVFVVLFSITWVVENPLLQDRFFTFAGDTGSSIISAFVTVLIFKPVDRLANRITDKLFPETMQDAAKYQRERSKEIYRSQVTYVLRDGDVSDREWKFLHGLRDQLGLAADEARQIEEETEKRLGVDSDKTGFEGRGSAPATISEMLSQADSTHQDSDQPGGTQLQK